MCVCGADVDWSGHVADLTGFSGDSRGQRARSSRRWCFCEGFSSVWSLASLSTKRIKPDRGWHMVRFVVGQAVQKLDYIKN